MLTRHRLIWILVGAAHLTLMAGLVVGDHWLTQSRQSATGNFVTVSLVSEEKMSSDLSESHSALKSGENLSSQTLVESRIGLPVDSSLVTSVSSRSSVYAPPVFLVRETPVYPAEAL
jgi:hypothetical protein